MGKNLLLSFEKLKQENKKQFNFQNKNDVNNDLLNEYNRLLAIPFFIKILL
ncbi:hypothetical protein [Spiroplasma poulsonii]|uniref:hypothetical protein n=1 Tax=Spiroplasma poulsonii TaxID=2138 RepID=UPI00131A4075|nr:hypothetical protein [Spiroplasma poulsonii]